MSYKEELERKIVTIVSAKYPHAVEVATGRVDAAKQAR